MSVDTSTTPGSCFSCFSTASVHEVPQTIPSTKKVTVCWLATLATDFAGPESEQPIEQPNDKAKTEDSTIPVGENCVFFDSRFINTPKNSLHSLNKQILYAQTEIMTFPILGIFLLT
jgi:hypothetical protein